MSIKPYANYKDSGVEWIGRIPSSWSVSTLGRVIKLVTTRASARTNPVALENIESWTGRFIKTGGSYDGEGTAFLPRDILFGKLRPYLAKAWLATDEGEAIGDFHVLRCADTVLPSFFQRVLLSQEIISQVDGSTYGAKMPRAGWGFLASLSIPMPSRSEQIRIVAFLDQETQNIESLIIDQERLISLIEEKRQAVISTAITKGLRPTTSLKDSGIENLGDIPAHWQIRPLASLINKITNGYVGPTRQILVPDGIRYLQSLHVKNNRITHDGFFFVTPEWSKTHSKSELCRGDVLIVQTGDIGQVATVTDEYVGCNCHALIIVSPTANTLDGDWLGWFFNSSYGRQTLLSIQTGALHPHLNCGNVREVSIPLPDLSEQREVARYVWQQTERFDALIFETRAAVELLKERRSALISAAVTGKIDVRNLVADDFAMQAAAE